MVTTTTETTASACQKSAHTPGPWKQWGRLLHVDGLVLPVVGSEHAPVAYLANEGGNTTTPANACLIASAPDLLEALESALDPMLSALSNLSVQCRIGNSGGGNCHSQNVESLKFAIASVRSAIARARGVK